MLDEIGRLIDRSVDVCVKEGAMKALSHVLQSMLHVPGVRIYCTGRTEYISLSALSSSRTSPLNPFPIILRPLRSEDIEDMLALASAAQQQQLPTGYLNLSCIATDLKAIRALSEQLADFSGGKWPRGGIRVEIPLQAKVAAVHGRCGDLCGECRRSVRAESTRQHEKQNHGH